MLHFQNLKVGVRYWNRLLALDVGFCVPDPVACVLPRTEPVACALPLPLSAYPDTCLCLPRVSVCG